MRKKLFLSFCALVMYSITTYAQTLATGKVVDEKGASIAGATVLEKGTKNGTVSSSNGSYTIKVKTGAKLIISAVGYDNMEVSAGSGVSVALATDAKSLSEVVVTGVGAATSKKKIGIAVESINIANQLAKSPTADVGQQLVGQIAGAQITSANGSPGAPVNILLRGVNSLNAGTTPMILLDGLQLAATDLNSLDLNSVEKVEVVQGAAAASIYGAQGANGVIQLFSKKGKSGKTQIDISQTFGTSELLNVGGLGKAKFHSLNTNANNEVVNASGAPLVFDSDLSHYADNVVWNSLGVTTNNNKAYDKNLQWYDHAKMFYVPALTRNTSIGISGAKDKFDFNISASTNYQESPFKGNGDYTRSNLNLNLGVELAKGLKLRTTTQVIYTKNTQKDPTGRTVVYAVNNGRPFANFDYKSPDGQYGAYFGDGVGVNHFNPNYIFSNVDVNDIKVDIVQNLNLNYRLNRFVELDAKYGLNYQNNVVTQNIADQTINKNAEYWQYWVEYYAPYWTSYGAPTTGSESGEIDNFTYRTTFQNFLTSATIRFDFEKDFHLKVPIKSTTFVAYDYRKNNFKQYISYGTDAPPFTPYTAADMATTRVVSDISRPFTTYGFLVSHKFEYGDIAGITAGFRSDYSSAFNRGQKAQTFPRGDVYVNLSSFNFWSNSKIASLIPALKLRASYGEAGIQPGASQRVSTYSTKIIGAGTALSFQTNNANPDLTVEISKELEIGTDLTFNGFKGSWFKTFGLRISYWDRKTENAIYNVDAAPSTGTGTIVSNAFGLKSNGIQAALDINIISKKNFSWNMTTNFSKQTSSISSVIGSDVVVTSAAGSTGYVLRAGEKIGQLYGYRMLHAVDEKDEKGNQYIPDANKANYQVASNGWVVYSDPTKPNYKQPYVTPGKYSFGDPNPKFNITFINEFTYKDFLSFSMQWDWLSGSHLYNQTKEWMYRDGIHSDYDKQITINNETGAWAAFYRGVYAQVSRNGTKNYFYEDASFFRLRNIALAVDFAKLTKIKVFNKLQLVLTGRNLVTFTKYTGSDPEVSSGQTNSAFDRGVDHNTIPNLRTYQVGLNIGL